MLKRIALTGACVAFLAAAPLARADWHVWTVTGTVRARRDTPPGEGRAVRLSAARDETESFQILMRAGAPVRGIRLQAGPLEGPGGATIPASRVRLFRQHFLHLTVPTYRNESFEPGWYADALIPLRHPLTGEPLPADARFRAVPFDLPAAETHGFLVDVSVPPDAAPGAYRGTLRLTAEGAEAVEVPVGLTVRGFRLPRVSTLRTAFGSPADRMRGHYRRRAEAGKEKEPADWDAVDRQCAAMLTRHRINATPPGHLLLPAREEDGAYRFTDEQVERLRAFVDRYHVNALSVRRPTSIVKDPEKEKKKLHAWLGAFDDLAERLDRPYITFYTYLKDEPNDAEAYTFVRRWGRAVREAGSVVRVLVVEQTWPQKEAWGDLYGAVDIWCALFPLFKAESAAKRQADGETVWAYTALCQARPTPWWHIDFPLLNYRVPAWIAWRYRIRGLLYWGGLSFWRQVDDPWTEPETLDRRDRGKGQVWNGEGSIVYPGRACGYEGIAPSLRLKALRDAVEDYEYFSILERAGRAEEAGAAVRPLVESWHEWNKDPAAYEKARARLAERIEAESK
jgi:hypothetical protein